jgi:hypothetical protein
MTSIEKFIRENLRHLWFTLFSPQMTQMDTDKKEPDELLAICFRKVEALFFSIKSQKPKSQEIHPRKSAPSLVCSFLTTDFTDRHR